MGLGILSVLAVHLNIMGYPPPIGKAFLDYSSIFVYVEGFFFLSGFGIFHSYANKSNLRSYYLRRIERLFIPYLIIMIPYIVITGLAYNESIGLIVLRILGISFWYEGNYSGMWFVHVLLLLYLIYPLFQKYLFVVYNHFYIKAFAFIIFYSIALYCLKMFFPSYYFMTSFALFRIPFFFFGAYVAYFNKRNNDVSWLLLWSLSYIIFSIANYSNIDDLRQIFMMTFFLPIWGCAINYLHKNNFVHIYKILCWFGKYTLEIYLLHMMITNVGLRLGLNVRISIILAEFLAILLCQHTNQFINYILRYGK